MTKVFLDTNVILDHALDRAFADEAEKIFAIAEADCEFFVTANIKDFRRGEQGKLPIVRPDDYLRQR